MTKKVKRTIEMKSADADKWLAALRSGKYEQGKNSLASFDIDTDKPLYCCLGVMQCVLGKVQKFNALPSLRWMKDHKIKADFALQPYNAVDSRNAETDIRINPVTRKGVKYDTLSSINDSGEFSFKEIARIIENNLKRM